MRSLLAFLAVAVPLCVSSPEAQAQVHYRYGIVTSILPPQHGAKVTELQSGHVRLDFYWDQIEISQDNYDWASIDASVNEALSRGFKVFASLSTTPSWAGPCETCLPYNLADWQEFVYRVIERYGWSPDIVFGVWNEPNLDNFLSDDNNGTQYARLFDYANRARNQSNPNARLGGPETSHHAWNDGYYANVMSRISGWLRGSDVVTVHWYPDGPALGTYLANVNAYAGGRELWLTETGYSTCNDNAQANTIQNILNTFETSPAAKIFIYVLQNGLSCTEALVRPDWSNRPAFSTYRNWISSHLPPPPPPTGPDILNEGEAMGPNDWIASGDGRFTLSYQSDGNLVLYRWDSVALWASNTGGTSPGQAVMQGDGNFVVYDGSGAPRWSSGTNGNSGAYLWVQNDGNVVIYSAWGAPLWATNTGGY